MIRYSGNKERESKKKLKALRQFVVIYLCMFFVFGGGGRDVSSAVGLVGAKFSATFPRPLASSE